MLFSRFPLKKHPILYPVRIIFFSLPDFFFLIFLLFFFFCILLSLILAGAFEPGSFLGCLSCGIIESEPPPLSSQPPRSCLPFNFTSSATSFLTTSLLLSNHVLFSPLESLLINLALAISFLSVFFLFFCFKTTLSSPAAIIGRRRTTTFYPEIHIDRITDYRVQT